MGIFGSKGTSEETMGNAQGKYEMIIQYCGGWGYKNQALATQREVEKMHPQVFKYVLVKDGGITGNFEISMSLNNQGHVS